MKAAIVEPRLRDAVEADIPAIVALVESAYRGDSSRRGWTTEAELLDGQRIDAAAVAAELGRERSRIRLLFSDGRMIACAHVCDENGSGYFGMFAVSPELQGAGIGKLVLDDAERIARTSWGLPRMRMTVIDLREELMAFYERRGYRRTGLKKPFPYGDARFGQPRRDDLRFEVMEKALINTDPTQPGRRR